MQAGTVNKVSFKEHRLKAREEAIALAVNQLLAKKGFEAMTVDAVAAQAGMAKASLYKLFSSKEDLACAAMVQILHGVLDVMDALPPNAAPLDNLRACVDWAITRQLQGHMPAPPGPCSGLRAALMASPACQAALHEVSQRLRQWIAAAQTIEHSSNALNPHLPVDAVLYSLYARACDPAIGFMRMGGYADAQIRELVLRSCFDGLKAS